MDRAITTEPLGARPSGYRSSARPPEVPAPPPKRRWLALDGFRFAAICLMVQGHVFTTLLDEATKAQSWYPHHRFVHGYTAPMFLFGAGLAFGLTTFRKWDAHGRFGPAVKKRLTRYGWLLLIGYSLRLPTLSITHLLALDEPSRIERLVRPDVLQHIAVTMLILQGLAYVIRDRRVYCAVVAALALFAVGAAPWIWNIDLAATSIPHSITGYLNASTGSTFPLVPWMGFTFVGVLLAYAMVGGGANHDLGELSRRFAWPITAAAALALVGPVLIDRMGPLPLLPFHNFWKVNPLFFVWRLGNALAVLAVLCQAERLAAARGWLDPAGSKPSLGHRIKERVLSGVEVIAAESLVIYVLHMVLIHGSVFTRGLKRGPYVFEHSHGVYEASWATLALFLIVALFAKVWSESKKQPVAFRAVQLGFGALVVFLMLS